MNAVFFLVQNFIFHYLIPYIAEEDFAQAHKKNKEEEQAKETQEVRNIP